MSATRSRSGFTLIELMVTLAVVAVIAVAAAPSMQAFLDKNRLVGAAEAIYTQIQSARSEAVKQSAAMVVAVTPGTAWCAGFSRGALCNCTAALGTVGACSILEDGQNRALKVVRSATFQGVTMVAGAPPQITFDAVRGTVPIAEAGSILLQSGLGRQMQIQVNALGRVRLCSPAGSVGGYPPC